MLTSSQRQLTRFARVLIALCLLPTLALTGPGTIEDYVVISRQILRSVIPGLKDSDSLRRHPPSLDDRAPLGKENSVSIHLYGPNESAGPEGTTRSAELGLTAYLHFNHQSHLYSLKDGQLLSMLIFGPFITDRRDRLAKEVDAHPEWTDTQVVAALKAAGAKFGPNDRAAFLRALPLKALEPFIGRLRVVSARFGVRYEPSGDESATADLGWLVMTKWHSQDGRYEAEYRMNFEPFEGVLTQLGVIGPEPVR